MSEEQRLWTLDDVSVYLGVATGTLYHWRMRGEAPPAIKLGKHLRFDPAAVMQWAREHAEVA